MDIHLVGQGQFPQWKSSMFNAPLPTGMSNVPSPQRVAAAQRCHDLAHLRAVVAEAGGLSGVPLRRPVVWVLMARNQGILPEIWRFFSGYCVTGDICRFWRFFFLESVLLFSIFYEILICSSHVLLIGFHCFFF